MTTFYKRAGDQMLQKIKDYALFILLALLGVAYYMLGRRGEKIKDLQADIIRKDLEKQLEKAQTLVDADRSEYDSAVNNYIIKRDRYNKLYPRK